MKDYTVIIWVEGFGPKGKDFQAENSGAAITEARKIAEGWGFTFMAPKRKFPTNGEMQPGTFGENKLSAWLQVNKH